MLYDDPNVHDWHYCCRFPVMSLPDAWRMLATGEPEEIAWQQALQALEAEKRIGHRQASDMVLQFVHIEPQDFGYFIEFRYHTKLRLGNKDA